MKKYKYYLFDFDGTLLNTMPALEYVFTVSYEHVGVKFNPQETVEFSRIPLDEGYARAGGNPAKWHDFCVFIEKSLDFPQALKANHLYPETLEFIEHLKQNKIVAGIVTSNKISHVKDVLDAMNLPKEIFSVYVGNKEYKRFKPYPDPVLVALEKLGNPDKKDVVYVGDGLNDMLSANRAGVDGILIDRENEFPDSDKYIKIKNLKELF